MSLYIDCTLIAHSVLYTGGCEDRKAGPDIFILSNAVMVHPVLL